jgi:hypothetical protein
MYTVNLIERETSKTAVENYASGFETYGEAREWADRHEMEFRACGWTAVVAEMAE